MKKLHLSKYRNSSGFSFIEVAISSFLVMILAVIAINISILVFACAVNDKACRDAVRAAAQQPNAAKAQNFALASIKNHKTDGFFISQIQLTNFNYNDFNGAPPPGQCPLVQVTTSVDVTLPAPLIFFGTSLTNKMKFSQIYTSPIIKTKVVMP
ncbi:MAG: hypothetical protein EKK48_04845 [Candidatus Melainabacteria bacterium]|nr:MAG: hypothetical protein EKK48_04845 [Candidatus Melainabacteria bacterium]